MSLTIDVKYYNKLDIEGFSRAAVQCIQNRNKKCHREVFEGAAQGKAGADEKRPVKGVIRLCKSRGDGILELQSVTDVFTDQPVDAQNYDVDHFIPWSFVMNDELWNLMPMDSSLNSSKSNRLPDWNHFFGKFAVNQYLLYGMIHEKEGIRRLYEACYKDNLHSIWANQELYRRGNSEAEFYGILEKNMRPVWDSARRQGYEVWER